MDYKIYALSFASLRSAAKTIYKQVAHLENSEGIGDSMYGLKDIGAEYKSYHFAGDIFKIFFGMEM